MMSSPAGQHKETKMDDLRMLVAYSSVHGATAEIARSIALTLCRTGIDAEARPVAEIDSVQEYDGVVLGSAVYGGKWMGEALDFLRQFALPLYDRDVWLFQSGPLGHSAQGIVRGLPVDVSVYAEYLRIEGLATFGGRHDGSSGGPVGRFLARAGFAGDYRDFTAIRLWAEEVARRTAMHAVTEKGSTCRYARVGARA
jgi:menaquinone-dependent protoporphyrinogen oxidase